MNIQKLRKACGSLIPAVLLLVFSKTAGSYPTPYDFNHRLLRWNLSDIDGALIVRVVAGDDVLSANLSGLVGESVEKWNDVEESRIEMRVSDYEDPHITVTFQGRIQDSTFSAGYAEFDKTKDNGDPVHCRIFVLADTATGYYSLSKTVLHELGHCIGLGHSLIPEAVMSYHLDKNSFDLDLDDEAAVSRLYPVNGDVSLPPGCATGSHAGRRFVFVFWLLLGIPPAFCLVQVGACQKYSQTN